MPGQGVGVDQALGSGSNSSPATLGLSPAPSPTHGTEPQSRDLAADPRSRTGTSHPLHAPRRHEHSRPDGSPTGRRLLRSRRSSPVMWERATRWPSPRGRLPWSWPWRSSACHPGLGSSSRHSALSPSPRPSCRLVSVRCSWTSRPPPGCQRSPRSARRPRARSGRRATECAWSSATWAGDPADVAVLAEAAGLPTEHGGRGRSTRRSAAAWVIAPSVGRGLPASASTRPRTCRSGKGGMVTTDDPERAERLRPPAAARACPVPGVAVTTASSRDSGIRDGGLDATMTDLRAAIGRGPAGAPGALAAPPRTVRRPVRRPVGRHPGSRAATPAGSRARPARLAPLPAADRASDRAPRRCDQGAHCGQGSHRRPTHPAPPAALRPRAV